jgi:hypothetical protein
LKEEDGGRGRRTLVVVAVRRVFACARVVKRAQRKIRNNLETDKSKLAVGVVPQRDLVRMQT